MQLDKSQILDLLKQQGDHGQAAKADSELPETVDTDRDAGLLSSLGLDPTKLIGLLTGGGGLGGLGGMLGR